MPKLPLALAASMLGGALLALVPSRPALAADSPSLSTGDGSATAAACGQGHLYVCSATASYKCFSWGLSVDSEGNVSIVCTNYIWVMLYEYRD